MMVGVGLLLAGFLVQDAQAQQMALKPQNRVHAGVAFVEDFNLGVTGGLDSRLTRLISVDAGGFVSAMDPQEIEVVKGDDPASWIVMRHALFVTPGIRIPHSYSTGVNWDFALRAGFAAVWSVDASVDYDRLADPALLGGGDFLLRKDAWGLRLNGKVLGFKPWSKVARDEVTLIRPQYALEVFYQW